MLRRADNVASLATEFSVVLLALISLALWTSIDRLRVGPGASFNVFGIPDLSLMVLMLIVISACHAGAFIPALKDSRTIIITAAAAQRTSFGCSNDRDLTYFGEAFYRDALPSSRSLEQAFSLAQTAIAKREASEHITPSEPQAYFGADLERWLSRHSLGASAAVKN
jgi:hypothetical protein